MKAEYDLAKMESRKNRYAAELKKPVPMRRSKDAVDGAMSHSKAQIDWPSSKTKVPGSTK